MEDGVMQVQALESDCWTGSLQRGDIVELLHWMHDQRCTAMLRVGDGLSACVVFFRQGALYRCEWGELKGDDAVQSLMQLQDGHFLIIQRAFPEPPRNVGLPTPVLLASA
jgi:hypothetical protein